MSFGSPHYAAQQRTFKSAVATTDLFAVRTTVRGAYRPAFQVAVIASHLPTVGGTYRATDLAAHGYAYIPVHFSTQRRANAAAIFTSIFAAFHETNVTAHEAACITPF